MTSALVWPARIVVLAGSHSQVMRGRPAEFRQRGLTLAGATGALDALASLGREPASAVVVPADRVEDDTAERVEAVHALTGTPVIIGVRELVQFAEWVPVLNRPDVRVVDLPITPVRLAAVLETFGHPTRRSDKTLRCGQLELSAGEHRVHWHGTEVRLPPRPFDVLELLMLEHPRIVTTQEFLDGVHPLLRHGWNSLGVRSAIKIIRQELRLAVPHVEVPLESVYGVGYRLVDPQGSEPQMIPPASSSTRV